MGRRKAEVTEEVNENVTPEAIEEHKEEVATEEKKETPEATTEEKPADTSATPEDVKEEDKKPEEDASDKETSEEETEEVEEEATEEDEATDENIEESEEPKALTSEGDEILLKRVSVLERTFDKKIREVAVYDIYRKGDLLQFRDRNGTLINSSFEKFEVAMRLFTARLFPLDKRAKGTTYSWTVIE